MTNDLEVGLEKYRIALRRLLVGWKASTQTFEVLSDRKATAHMVIAWSTQVHRFGRAFLRLEKHGLEHEAHPLVRSAFEYAVVGHWVAHVGDNAVIARYGKDQDKLKALVTELKGSRNDVVPPQWKAEIFAAAIDDEPVAYVGEREFIDNFERICREIGLPGTLYPVYRVLCWITHPTTHAAQVYIPKAHTLTKVPIYGSQRPIGLVGLMAHAVYWSRRTVDDLIVGHPYQDWLDELAQSINVTPRLPTPKLLPNAET